MEDANNVCLKEEENAVLLSQTTFSKKEFDKIKEILVSKNNSLQVVNTICSATKERQESLVALCKQVDAVVVIGGKNSANTNRLFQIAKENHSAISPVPCRPGNPVWRRAS